MKYGITAALALAGLAAAFGAQAQDNESGFYAGAGVGSFNLDIDDVDDVTTTVDRYSSDDTAWKAFAGWRMNKYLAFEGAYVNLGSPDGTIACIPATVEKGRASHPRLPSARCRSATGSRSSPRPATTGTTSPRARLRRSAPCATRRATRPSPGPRALRSTSSSPWKPGASSSKSDIQDTDDSNAPRHGSVPLLIPCRGGRNVGVRRRRSRTDSRPRSLPTSVEPLHHTLESGTHGPGESQKAATTSIAGVFAACSRTNKVKIPRATQADVASAQAEATQDVAEAQSDASKSAMESNEEMALAKAVGEHKIEIERCEALPGDQQKACKDMADAPYEAAKAAADLPGPSCSSSPCKEFAHLNKTLVALIASGAVLSMAACSATRTQRVPGEQVDDVALLSSVKSALVSDKVTDAGDINVDVNRGVVKLSGFVDNTQQRSQAAAVARKVSGVKSVQNDIAVKSAASSTAGEYIDDSVLTAKVKTALIESSATKAHQINVETDHGVVQLSGFVDNAAAKTAATTVAKSVTGVKDVKNELSVKSY